MHLQLFRISFIVFGFLFASLLSLSCNRRSRMSGEDRRLACAHAHVNAINPAFKARWKGVYEASAALAARAVPERFTCHCNPSRPINQASSRKVQLLSSFLYYFSLSYFDQPSKGADIGRFERFFFLLLALVCQAFCFCWGDSNFLELLRLIDLKLCFLFLLTRLPYVWMFLE